MDTPTLHVLARDADWIVVAKPPRLLVHRAPQAAAATHHALQIVRDQVGAHVFPIHRLDRPTSGCLLFATTKAAAAPLQEALTHPDAVKTYLALVRGHWNRGEGAVIVDKPMNDDQGVSREATSEIRCVATSVEPRCSLLIVRPRTGRFHQVRRHARDLDHPVIGDHAHGDTRVNRTWREERGADRLGLHCLTLDLPLPDGTRIQATCPLFEDHHRVWSALPWWSEAVERVPALALPPFPVPDYCVPDEFPSGLDA